MLCPWTEVVRPGQSEVCMMKTNAYLILLVVLLAACQPPASAITEATLPSVSPTPDEAFLADASAYAEQFGVSLEEATRRRQLQADAGIGALDAALQSREAETFAG